MKKIIRPLFKGVFMLVCVIVTGLFTGNYSQAARESITMKYDDYFSGFKYSSVSIVNPGKPVSYKVGYGVKSGTKDDAVVSVEKGVLHATGIGKARVKIDGEEYDVTVEAAPISMFLLIGQSNMYGNEGDENQSVANENGTVYSTVGEYEVMSEKNAIEFVPSSLSGNGSLVNLKGTKNKIKNNPVNRLTQAGKGKIGLDSGFAYKWHEMTGDKVWLVNAAHGSTNIKKWQKGQSEYNEALVLFTYAQQVMQKEIKAGHYVLKTYGYLWCQGCSDRANSAEYYVKNFLSMHNNLKKDLAFDIDADGTKEKLRFCDIIMPRAGKQYSVGYRSGTYDVQTVNEYFQSFDDLEMRGHRVAQYWLVNNPDYKDINLISNIGDSWTYMPDGSSSVRSYFRSRYKNGRVDYPVQVKQADSWYTPKSPAHVHDNIHYNQIGYNEIGIDAAENAVYTHNRAKKPAGVKTTVTFYDWTGYKEVSSVSPTTWKDSRSLIVPVVYPVYESKKVTYKVSENLTYDLYDLTAAYGSKGGELVAVGADTEKKVTVVGKASNAKGRNYYSWTGTKDGLVQDDNGKYPVNRATVTLTSNGKGTVEKGVHSNVVYRLERTVNLLHNHEWVVEWSGRSSKGSTSAVSFMPLSENIYIRQNLSSDTNYFWQKYDPASEVGQILLGRTKQGSTAFDNSKVTANKLVGSLKDNHVYRIYNEVNKDGSNRIYLSIDGIYCGEYKNVSGRDFAFRFIGAASFEVDDYILNYVRISEDSHKKLTGHTVRQRETDSGCMNINYKEIICQDCDYVKREIIPRTNHKYTLKEKKATCTADGYKRYECSCGSFYGNTVLSKTGHKYSAYKYNNDATYLADGTKTAVCSSCGNKKTVAAAGTKLVLKPPSKIIVTPGDDFVKLTWSKVKDAAGYRVYVKSGNGWKTLRTTAALSYTVSSLKMNSTYVFAVKAYTKAENKTVWSKAYSTVTASTTPSAPVLRLASTAEGRATLVWSDVNGETGYQIWYSTSGKGNFSKVSNYDADTTREYITSLRSGKTYYFKIRAYQKTGAGYFYSSFSDVKSVTVK